MKIAICSTCTYHTVNFKLCLVILELSEILFIFISRFIFTTVQEGSQISYFTVCPRGNDAWSQIPTSTIVT